jgi:hypothetical protein
MLLFAFVLLLSSLTFSSCKACNKKETEPSSADASSIKTGVLPVQKPAPRSDAEILKYLKDRLGAIAEEVVVAV